MPVTLRSKTLQKDGETLTSDGRSTPAKQEVHLITGGGGFAGFCLGRRLAGQGHRVILADVNEPLWDLTNNMEFVKVGMNG